jgi:transposase
MSHYHLDRKRAACDVYKFLMSSGSQTELTKEEVMKIARTAAGGASQRAIYRWLKEDFSPEAVGGRPERRGAKKSLSEDQRALLVGFAISTRSLMEPVTLTTLEHFCRCHFTVTPSIPTLSRMMTEFGFSSQKAMSRASRMVSLEVVDAALSTIEEIRSYDFAPDQLLFMDETGLWSNVRELRTYHFRNWYEGSTFLL